ncbi:MAG: hypothetical protein ACRDTE_00450 [Pseudonocardiaceae bacterium]
MGIRNKQRRAAKARARARTGRRPPAREEWTAAHIPSQTELLTLGLLAAADAVQQEEETEAQDYVEQLAAADPAVVDAASRSTGQGMITAMWRAGWLPVDLHQITQRRRGGAVLART